MDGECDTTPAIRRAAAAATHPDEAGDGCSQHYLLLGICGSGMRAFAEILLDAGCMVTGTDLQLVDADDVQRLSSSWRQSPAWHVGSMRFCTWRDALSIISVSDSGGRSAEGIPIDQLVTSAAVSGDDSRIQAARQKGLPTQLLASALATRFSQHSQFCVAGTHGKSTTSGLLWWILEFAGRSPSAFVGGQLVNNDRSGCFRPHGFKSSIAVIESCEYRGAFLEFSPAVTVLTGIERDHFDCYPTVEQEDLAFERFLSHTSPDGLLIVNGDCPRSMRITSGLQTKRISCGLESAHRWHASNIRPARFGVCFDVICRGTRLGSLQSPLYGIHNVRNILEAVVAAAETGIPYSEIAAAVSEYRGIRRRFEHRQSWREMDFIDDYAHHPTAIELTLAAARQIYGSRRLIVAFEPHQISRTKQLFEGFCQSLRQADECLILPVLAAREKASEAESSQLSDRLVRGINRAGGHAFLFGDLDQVVGRIDHAGRPGDVLITMGAGRINQIHDEFHRRLRRNFAA